MELGREKARQACKLLDELNLDCWLLWVRETDQMPDPSMKLLMEGDLVWPSALLLSRTMEGVAIVGRYDVNGLPEGLFDRIIPYDRDVAPHLVAELTRLDPASIAINVSRSSVAADGLTAGMRDWLHEILAETPFADRLVKAEALIAALRGRKIPREVDCIRRAVQTTEEIFDEIIPTLRVGMTELEVRDRFHAAVFSRSAGLAWNAEHNPAVDAGPDKEFGHAGAGDRRIRAGHLLHFDFGVRVSGYCSDLQRMVFFGARREIPDEVGHAFATVRRAITDAAEALRPGTIGADIDAIARGIVTEAGYDEYLHALGHQVGRNAHDGGVLLGPRWERYGDAPNGAVEVGNVFTLELGVRTANYGMVSLEEDVLVTPRGCEFLSSPQTELICRVP
jgi:Xaa-Pro aminopeptidase